MKKWTWASWEFAENRVGFKKMKCDRCTCDARHLAIGIEKPAFDPEETILKRLCDEHFNKATQKKWLQKWKKNNI